MVLGFWGSGVLRFWGSTATPSPRTSPTPPNDTEGQRKLKASKYQPIHSRNTLRARFCVWRGNVNGTMRMSQRQTRPAWKCNTVLRRAMRKRPVRAYQFTSHVRSQPLLLSSLWSAGKPRADDILSRYRNPQVRIVWGPSDTASICKCQI